VAKAPKGCVSRQEVQLNLILMRLHPLGSKGLPALASVTMTSTWPHRRYTFYALHKTCGPMWLRCDVSRTPNPPP